LNRHWSGTSRALTFSSSKFECVWSFEKRGSLFDPFRKDHEFLQTRVVYAINNSATLAERVPGGSKATTRKPPRVPVAEHWIVAPVVAGIDPATRLATERSTQAD